MDAFYALAEPRRRRVLELLASRGRLTATQICREFEVTPQAVSQHLNVLREAGLISMEKQGQRRIYGINPERTRDVEEWADEVTSTWNRRFDALGGALDSEKKARATRKGRDRRG
ncbi:MAG: winged helix-turn-helix transcriptional regulator [Nitrososphaerota archaeon]|nr:winged helix-turn-helix transcriptional regulator [Nitrososphaerota archaeon]MDG7026256.1 winged helix-turn-helix transcriptional regulator [Nitrososphaerota archaeon]